MPEFIPTANNQAGASAKSRTRTFLIAAISFLVTVLILGLVALTFLVGCWGTIRLPEATQLVSADQNGNVQADAVVKALKGKGIKAVKKNAFSGLPLGIFVAYEGHKPGDNVRRCDTVAVLSSAGPGVPAGIAGKKARDVSQELANMGVTIHYKGVPVENTNKHPLGTVITTYPRPGSGLPESEHSAGIYVGVTIASDGSSIPADMYGRDADKVKTELTNRGYKVNYVAHLASRQNVGKVVGTSPTPGVALHSGQKVTLYYGADSKGLRQRYDQLMAKPNRGSVTGSAPEELYSKATVGRWCRNNGECLRIDDTDSPDYEVILAEGAFGQAADNNENIVRLYPCEHGVQSVCTMDSDQNSLWKLGFGAYELIPVEYLFPWCGNTLSGQDVDGCQNGQVAEGENFKGVWSGAKWKIQDYLMVFPVGSQLKQVIDTGMFSSDELQKANKVKPVDGDRPFILHQDPKLYPEKEKSADADLNNPDENSDWENPFLPGVAPREKGLMKPAPSDETAYYLVEELTVDWNTLTDVDLDSLGQTKGSKSQTVPTKPLPSVETLMNSRIVMPEGVCADGAIKDNDGTVQLVNGTWDINGSNSEIGGNLEVAAPMKVGNRELLAALFTCDQGSINTYSYVGFYDADLNQVPLKWESYTTLSNAIDNAGLAEGNHGTPILDMQVGTDTIHLVYGLYEKSQVCACPFGQFPVDYSWDGKQWKLSKVGQFIPPDLNY